MEFMNEEEKICRYCFDDNENESLISPCACSGGQKYVHLNCLRRWQRMVLVSQPTHPAFYEDDVRHHKCNVCLSEYTCPPPTRGELMESFTGPEIAALLMTDRIICSRDIFSDALEREVEGMSPMMRAYSSYEHWIKGTYLINSVEKDNADITIPLTDKSSVTALSSKLNDQLEISLQGKSYRLVAEKSLGFMSSAVSGGVDGAVPALRQALKELSVPAEIVLASTTPITSADDNISAVNISRRVAAPIKKGVFENIVDKVALKYPRVREVEIHHFIGRPVEEEQIATCIVTGSSRGWSYVKTLEKALLLSLSRRSHKKFGAAQGNFGGGQTVEIVGLKGRQDLNGQYGITARFVPSVDSGKSTGTVSSTDSSTAAAVHAAGGRWEVLLSSGEGVRVKPINLKAVLRSPESAASSNLQGDQNSTDATEEPAECGPGAGRVLVFWGVARWTRAQLLGEIARGHWGLCRATAHEFILKSSAVWPVLTQSDRLVYAPNSDMTDQLVSSGEAQRQMEAVSHVAQMSSASTQQQEGASGGDGNGDPLQEEEEIEELEAGL
mmetsp:Transcript_21799/g.36732  ORF Transcript_21799/g.36732 Transcript_21799/m.36732 type:complete len:555 (+) Transcript_21799:92-1756(+)